MFSISSQAAEEWANVMWKIADFLPHLINNNGFAHTNAGGWARSGYTYSYAIFVLFTSVFVYPYDFYLCSFVYLNKPDQYRSI